MLKDWHRESVAVTAYGDSLGLSQSQPIMVDEEEVEAPEDSVYSGHNRWQRQELEHLQEAWG